MNGLWPTMAVFFVLLVLRVPVYVVLFAASLIGVVFAPLPIQNSVVASAAWQGVNHFVLLAIPFFVLVGDLGLASGVTRRLVDAAKGFVGHIHGGLAHVSITVNMVMAGMSGSDLADAAATGKLLIPAMRQSGYPSGYAASVIAGAAMIGPLIPPSISFLIFASVTDVSVGRLFLAGAIPGGMLGLMLMTQSYLVARRKGYPVQPRMPYRQRASLTLKSLPVMLVPVAVLGSFFTGIATPTESAVFGVLAVLLIGLFVYRELTFGEIGTQLISTARMIGTIFVIIAAAAVFGRVLTLYGAAASLSDWVTHMTTDPIVFLLIVNVLFLVLGCIVDTLPIMIVLVPLMMPTVMKLGIDPVHFGVITVFNLLIGLVTPPYGLTMFLLCKMTNISMVEYWRYMWPIVGTMIFALLLITLYPPISMWLPNLLLPVQ